MMPKPSTPSSLNNQILGDVTQPNPNIQAQQISPASVASPFSLIKDSNLLETMLPKNLQITPNNPLFSPNASQQAQQTYYNQAIAPQLGAGAEQEFLGGNLGANGQSSFGADYMGNLAATGDQQAFSPDKITSTMRSPIPSTSANRTSGTT